MKRFPDLFLEAARRLGVAPKQGVVIENVKRACWHSFSAADGVLPSLEPVPVERIEGLQRPVYAMGG